MSKLMVFCSVVMLFLVANIQGQAWYADHHKRLSTDDMIARITRHADRMAAEKALKQRTVAHRLAVAKLAKTSQHRLA